MPSFTERYHELTKYNPTTIDRLGPVHWEEQPTPFKEPPEGKRIEVAPGLKPLFDSFDEAKSRFTLPTPWDAHELGTVSRLLYFTLGLTARMIDAAGGEMFLRAAPSAGGLYPTEVYVAAKDVQGLADGLYHYHSLQAALIPILEGDFSADLRHHFLEHPALERAGFTLLFTGMFARSAWRYKERAYRRILLDTGHAVGNLLAACHAAGLDATLMGSFLDDRLEELFFLEAKEEFPLLGVAVGPPGSAAPLGERPSDHPAEAARAVASEYRDAPMQIQQNRCERIPESRPLRKPVPRPPNPFAGVDTDPFDPLPVILKRRSCRRFNGGSMQRKTVEDMLAYALRSDEGEWRLAPGACELHLIALAVEGMRPGIYRLDGDSREWVLRSQGDFREACHHVCLGQELAAQAAFMLVTTADMAALTEKYGDRGYRYACMDAGILGERINLFAVQAGFGSTGIGGYFDDMANEMLEAPLEQGILYITLAGVSDEG